MAGNDFNRMKSAIEREAVKQGIDLDDIREVDSDESGTVVRVVETDGPTEKEQVGFEVKKVTGPNSFQAFESTMRNYMRALRDHVNGDDESSTDTEEDREPETTESTDTDTTTETTEDTQPTGESVPVEQTQIKVKLTADSLEDMTSLLEDRLEDARIASEEYEELTERLDDVDQRLSDIEERLSILGGS